TLLVESVVTNASMGLTGIRPNNVSKGIINAQLKRGFTVIRYSKRSETELGMSIVPLGQHPFRPFQIQQSERITLNNDRTKVHSEQQNYVSSINVNENDQALYITATVDSAPTIDLLLVP